MQLESNFYYERDLGNKFLSISVGYDFKGVEFGASVSIFPKDRVGIGLNLGVFGFDVSLDWY